MKEQWKIEQERRIRSENRFALFMIFLTAIIAIGVIAIFLLLGRAVIELFIWPCCKVVFGF